MNIEKMTSCLCSLYAWDNEDRAQIEAIVAADPFQIAQNFEALLDKVASPTEKRHFYAYYGLDDGVMRSFSELATQYATDAETVSEAIRYVERKCKHPLKRKAVLGV